MNPSIFQSLVLSLFFWETLFWNVHTFWMTENSELGVLLNFSVFLRNFWLCMTFLLCLVFFFFW